MVWITLRRDGVIYRCNKSVKQLRFYYIERTIVISAGFRILITQHCAFIAKYTRTKRIYLKYIKLIEYTEDVCPTGLSMK